MVNSLNSSSFLSIFTVVGLIASCFGIAVLAAVYEVLKRTRMKFQRHHEGNMLKLELL